MPSTSSGDASTAWASISAALQPSGENRSWVLPASVSPATSAFSTSLSVAPSK